VHSGFTETKKTEIEMRFPQSSEGLSNVLHAFAAIPFGLAFALIAVQMFAA
jgi:hypothetical protein